MSKKPIPAAALWAEPPIPTRIHLLHRECDKKPAQIPNPKPGWIWGFFPAFHGDFLAGARSGAAPGRKKGNFYSHLSASPKFCKKRGKIWFSGGGSDLIPDIPGIPGTPRAAEIFTFPNFSVPKRSHFFSPDLLFIGKDPPGWNWQNSLGSPRDLGWKFGAGISGIRIPTPEGSVLPSPGCGGNEECFGIAPKARNKRES